MLTKFGLFLQHAVISAGRPREEGGAARRVSRRPQPGLQTGLRASTCNRTNQLQLIVTVLCDCRAAYRQIRRKVASFCVQTGDGRRRESLTQNTLNIDRLTLTRHFDNPSFQLARNIFEGGLFVIAIFVLAYAFVENSDRDYAHWIPSMQQSFVNLIWFLFSTELLPLLGSQFKSDSISEKMDAFSFLVNLIFKVLVHRYWINMMFFLVDISSQTKKREGEMLECLKTSLKGITIISILLNDSFRWALTSTQLIEPKYAEYLPIITIGTLIIRSVVMVILVSNICMLTCNSTLK